MVWPSSLGREPSGRSAKRAVVRTLSRATNRYERLGGVHRAYWRARLGLLAEDGTVRVGGTTADFAVTTRSERRRVRHLGGERRILRALLDGLTGSETVWDVGACVGTYACFTAKRLSDGHVVAFEPELTNRRRLEENLAANAPRDRWDVSPAALSDADGTGTLASEFVEAGGGHHYLIDSDDGIPVERRRGESLLDAGTPAPDILKVDVQGAELRVLRGMGSALDSVNHIYLEVHSTKTERYGSSSTEVEAFLQRAGYSLERLGEPANGRPGVYFLYAHR